MDDPEEAQRQLEIVRDQLEQIAGPELSRGEPPALPSYPDLDGSAEEYALVERLRQTPLEEWSTEDRARLEAYLDRVLPLVANPEPRSYVLDPVQGETPAALIQTGRLLSLRDSSALLQGREGAVLAGLEERLGLAERLIHQNTLLGPRLGSQILAGVLGHVQALVERPGTSSETLEELDGMLLRWRSDLPDAAAVIARQGLSTIRSFEEGAAEKDLRPGVMTAAMTVPIGRAFVDVARVCREEGCCRAIAARMEEAAEDPYSPVDLHLPLFFDGLIVFEALQEMTSFIAKAVDLRLMAMEEGGYPAELDEEPAVPFDCAAGVRSIEYERLEPNGGARLVWPFAWTGDTVAETLPQSGEEPEFLTVELPRIPTESAPDAD